MILCTTQPKIVSIHQTSYHYHKIHKSQITRNKKEARLELSNDMVRWGGKWRSAVLFACVIFNRPVFCRFTTPPPHVLTGTELAEAQKWLDSYTDIPINKSTQFWESIRNIYKKNSMVYYHCTTAHGCCQAAQLSTKLAACLRHEVSEILLRSFSEACFLFRTEVYGVWLSLAHATSIKASR